MIWALLLIAAPARVVVTDLPLDDASVAAAFSAETVLRPRVDDDAARAEKAAVAVARKRCAEGKKLAVALDSVRAIAKYEEALALYERSRPAIVDYKDVRSCAIDLGVARIDAERSPDAAFTLALRFAPTHRLDPGRYRPNVVARFERVREEIARASTSIVSIVATPAGTNVVIDGVARGVTPLSLSLGVGVHWLYLAAPGHRAIHAAFTVHKGEAERVELFLQPDDQQAATRLLELVSATRTPDNTRKLAADLVVVSGKDGAFVARRWRANEAAPDAIVRETTLAALALAIEAPPPAPASQPVSQPASREIVSASIPVVVAPRILLQPPKAPERVHWGLAWMPLGIAQFIEKRPLAGALFLITEVALIVTNIACYYALVNDRLPNGRFRDVDRAEALRWTSNLSLIALGAELIGGAIEGELRR